MMSLPIALLVAAASALVAAAPVEALQPDAADAQPPHAADATYRAVERDATSPDGSPDGNRQQAEASIEQVERDLVRIATFADEVRRTLDQEEHARRDVTHAIGYFRRQVELHTGEREVAAAHIERVEAEVVSLQRRVGELEGKVRSCESDREALDEAKRHALKQAAAVFAKISEGVAHFTDEHRDDGLREDKHTDAAPKNSSAAPRTSTNSSGGPTSSAA